MLRMMKTNPDTTPELYIGLDVHKEQTAVAVAEPGATGVGHHDLSEHLNGKGRSARHARILSVNCGAKWSLIPKSSGILPSEPG
jgi:hypothetical protein